MAGSDASAELFGRDPVLFRDDHSLGRLHRVIDLDRHLQFYRVWCEVSAAAINKQLNDYASLVEPIKLL